ncbi:MAG: sulfotransferase family 2 domain-containing protein [Candidatus Nanoarchaeia archaeon]
MDDNILWIHLHPPRTGGNTIVETILKHFPREEIYMTSLARYGIDTEKFDKNKVRFILGHATYYGIDKLVPQRVPRYFVILRDPAERLVSHYNAKMQDEEKKIPFDKWYKNQIKNEMVNFLDLKFRGSESSRMRVPRFILPLIKRVSYKTVYFFQTILFNLFNLNKKNDLKKLENAKKLLDLCWFVGTTEGSKKDFKFIFNSIGLKDVKYKDNGVSKKVVKIDNQLRERIYKDNSLDVELYKYGLELNKRLREKYKIK